MLDFQYLRCIRDISCVNRFLYDYNKVSNCFIFFFNSNKLKSYKLLKNKDDFY